ncbi:IS110 family transposase [Streptomyces sp. NPDC056002]|uniref:IS110 family transposase n=1 Tax=Actinomycetes TaxID=1760 RepID=UPI00148F52DB|nr:IS110 family transposase [Mycolicibacterium fortuitum]NOQ00300.1 IS110 family transposase [Mycolicibacterium fortuitum]WAY17996.1 IS110 family transposase [Mycolicibacterium fortuitum]
MTTDRESCRIVIGVDTHKSTHHVAAVHADTAKLLGDQEFPATMAGYRKLLKWAHSHGELVKAGVEGTGSYGAGLHRYMSAQGVAVIEVSRPNRQDRRARGKSDPMDAINAARAVVAETATVIPKDRDGFVEAVRMIRAARRSAVKARRAALHQIHGLLWCAPEDLRAQLSRYDRAALVARCARLRIPRTAIIDDATVTTRRMLRRLAKRIEFLDEEIAEANEELDDLLSENTPNLLSVKGVGTEAAGQIITTAGENIDRLKSESSLARICGVAPIPASSGSTTRHRLHRGGDRNANSSIYLIVVNRLRWDEPTKAYAARRTQEGKTKKEIIRCLKRAVVRELYRALQADLTRRKVILDAA